MDHERQPDSLVCTQPCALLAYATFPTVPADTLMPMATDTMPVAEPIPQRPKRKMPEWITGYFWSPKY